MKRRKMNYDDALYVFQRANPDQLEDWASCADFKTAENWARELSNYCPLSWTVLLKGKPVAILGAYRTTSTTFTGWCMTVTEAPRKVWAYMAKFTKILVKYGFDRNHARRLHAMVCTNRKGTVFFASKVGMDPIAELKNYGKGKDFMLMAITKRG